MMRGNSLEPSYWFPESRTVVNQQDVFSAELPSSPFFHQPGKNTQKCFFSNSPKRVEWVTWGLQSALSLQHPFDTREKEQSKPPFSFLAILPQNFWFFSHTFCNETLNVWHWLRNVIDNRSRFMDSTLKRKYLIAPWGDFAFSIRLRSDHNIPLVYLLVFFWCWCWLLYHRNEVSRFEERLCDFKRESRIWREVFDYRAVMFLRRGFVTWEEVAWLLEKLETWKERLRDSSILHMCSYHIKWCSV